MGLGTILGGAGMAEQGFEAGVRQSKADQMQDRADELRTQQLATEQQLLPEKAALARKQIATTSADLGDKETLRPGALQNAQAQQDLDHQEIVGKVAKGIMTNAITADQGRDTLLGSLGMKVETGDSTGAASLLNEMGKTPLFPRMKEFGSAVDMKSTQAPAGATDIAGQPITGPAIQVTFDNGGVQLLNPAMWQRQVATQKAALDKAAQVKMRPGDTIYNTRTGKAAFTAPAPAGYEMVGENPDGTPIYRKLGTPGTGTGAGKGGKPTKDETIAAVDGMLKDVSEKPTAEQKGQAYTLAQRAIDSGAVADPMQAAQLGIDAALHPEKIKPTFNPETATVDRVYQEPSFAQGRRITVAPNAVKLDDYAKTVEPSTMKSLADAQLQREASVAPEEQRGALRDQWIKVANDPELRARFLDAAAAKGGAQGRAVAQAKLELIQKFGPKPAGAPGAAPAGGGVMQRLRSGGLGGYVPPEGSPAARAAESRAQGDAKAAERDAVKAESARILSSQFQKDLAAMEPLALARKYDSLRSQLNPLDARALADATKKI